MFPLVFLLLQIGLPPEIRLDEDLFERPEWVSQTISGQYLVIDRAACNVLRFAKDGSFIHSFGQKGQGPGELQSPILVYQINQEVGVYDANGVLNFYDLEGVPLRQIRLPRATSAKEKDDLIILHSPLGTKLFTAYDKSGDKLFETGKGMAQQVQLDRVSDFLKVFTIRKDHTVFGIGMKGQNPITYGEDSLKETPLDFDFTPFTRKRKTEIKGDGRFDLLYEQPIRDLSTHNGNTFCLIENENSGKKSIKILVFDENGSPLTTYDLSENYSKMVTTSERLFLLGMDDAIVDGFPLPPMVSDR